MLAVCFLMASYAFATISIKVPHNVIEYGNTDIVICCIVNGSSLFSTEGIQLKRSDNSIVSISKYGTGISWQDKSLQNRSEINATIENVNQSFLHLKIFACNVERTDEATYYCDLEAIKKDISEYQGRSEQISLNITGFVDEKTEKCVVGPSSHASLETKSDFSLMLIAVIFTALN